jgi:eukaryotic-like serine/threonine-protein kinase
MIAGTAEPPVRAGVVLAGKYELLSSLGEGGMGVVWRARDVRLSSPVAVKLIRLDEANNPEIRERFAAEAKMAAALASPHIVHVFDVGQDDASGVSFIAMELLEGETLRERLRREVTLPASQVAQIVTHVARGLTRAHEQRTIHRDLKPANIFLVRNADTELAKVLDFGIAKQSSTSLRAGPTLTGQVLGTPHYMSPEQIMGSKGVDYRTDLWSLAVIAFECLTGRLPFDADNLPGLAIKICHGLVAPASTPEHVPVGFDRWFGRATSPDPGARFGSAAEMAEELRKLCGSADAATWRHAAPPDREPRPASAAATRASLAATAPESQGTGVPMSRTSTFARPVVPLPASVYKWRRLQWGVLALASLAGTGVWWQAGGPGAVSGPGAVAPTERIEVQRASEAPAGAQRPEELPPAGTAPDSASLEDTAEPAPEVAEEPSAPTSREDVEGAESSSPGEQPTQGAPATPPVGPNTRSNARGKTVEKKPSKRAAAASGAVQPAGAGRGGRLPTATTLPAAVPNPYNEM